MEHFSTNPNAWVRVLRVPTLQLILTLILTNAAFATDGKGQEMLDRRVIISTKHQRVEVATKRIGRPTNGQLLANWDVVPPNRSINVKAQNDQVSQVPTKRPTPLNLSYNLAGQPISIKREAAQDRQITGRVVGEDGQGIPGVNIQIKSTTRGTTSDVNGNYRLAVPEQAGTILVFSYIGYLTQEIPITALSTINVTLATDNKTLNEVVVVGYGTQNKRDITGAVASVSEATLKEVPSSNIVDQLKGRAAGVTIISNGSTPGSQGQIRIRGNRTLTSDQNSADALDGPLVVVDGIPFGGLNDINPNDIANMEVLKDASATAIYGSRGAGGVILITTQTG